MRVRIHVLVADALTPDNEATLFDRIIDPPDIKTLNNVGYLIRDAIKPYDIDYERTTI